MLQGRTERIRRIPMGTNRLTEDSRQQKGKHNTKHAWWREHGVEVERRKLDFGDYMTEGSNVVVDTKRSIAEIAQNVTRDHRRFADECDRARDAGYRLVVLVDAPARYATLADLCAWVNDHCAACNVRRGGHCDPSTKGRCPRHKTVKPVQGPRLSSTMQKMERDHGVRFELCSREDAAKRICELLGVDYD